MHFPRAATGESLATIGRWLDFYRDGQFIARGRIADREIRGRNVEIAALGEEVLLEDVLLPPAYGETLGPLDLADWRGCSVRARSMPSGSAG